MPKVINAKNWNLTPAADGRRYSKFPDGDIGSFPVSAYTPGGESSIAYRIYDPVGATWSAWIDGEAAGVGGTVTQVSGTPLAGPFAFTDQSSVTADTVIESDQIAISFEGHELQIRRRSSVTAGATRIAYAVVDGVESAAWSIISGISDPENPPPPEEVERNDVLQLVDFSTFASDEYNPLRPSAGEIDWRTVDGFRAYKHPADGQFDFSNEVKAIPHMEIRGAKVGAAYAANGEHVVTGDRACLLYVYHYDHTPYVPYNDADAGFPYGTGNAARSRIDCDINSYLRNTLFHASNSRYGSSGGFYQEFWMGFSIWFPPDFTFDRGAGTNFSIMAACGGSSGQLNSWELAHPTISSTATRTWKIGLRNYNNGGSTLEKHWPIDLVNHKGTHNHWVFHWKADPRAVGSGFSGGFIRVWHNVTGAAPKLIVSEGWNSKSLRFGRIRNGTETTTMKAPSTYKSAMHARTGTGTGDFTYGGLLGGSNTTICIGWDAYRLLGNNGDFASAHPLGQSMPDPSIAPLVSSTVS